MLECCKCCNIMNLIEPLSIYSSCNIHLQLGSKQKCKHVNCFNKKTFPSPIWLSLINWLHIFPNNIKMKSHSVQTKDFHVTESLLGIRLSLIKIRAWNLYGRVFIISSQVHFNKKYNTISREKKNPKGGLRVELIWL